MEGVVGSGHLKRPRRPLADQDFDPPPPLEKRPRFPKGKKAKRGDDAKADVDGGGGIGSWIMDPKLAAKERARRRSQIREDELFQGGGDVSSAEVYYEDDANFEEDGIQIEQFNLKQEREEGYFDADGNFVHCRSQNEIKDAWLDSVDVESRFAEKDNNKIIPEEDDQDLSSEDIGKIKRSIANQLQPGETIIQALKRLKSTSSDNRGKMSELAKHTFDQLTEDAMKLLENGEYNVYHEEREIFEREAEGYERLASARDGTVGSEHSGFDVRHIEDAFPNGMGHGATHSSVRDMPTSSSEANVSSLQVSSSDVAEELDMFGEDDEKTHENLQSDGAMYSGSNSEQILQPTSRILESSHDLGSEEAVGGGLESDYVYDQSTGYYYSSSSGYYYDPASGFYCCATSGTWYSFDENAGAYTEIQSAASEEETLSAQ